MSITFAANFVHSLNADLKVLKGSLHSYLYSHNQFVFDKNREWLFYLDMADQVFDDYKVVVLVRDPVECVASFLRLKEKEPITYTAYETDLVKQELYPTTLGLVEEFMSYKGAIGRTYTALYEASVIQQRAKDFLFIDYHKLCANPQKELNKEFIKYSEFLIKNNVSVPKIEAFDSINGFMLIEDFGDKVFLDEVNSSNRKNLYLLAIDQIIKLQSADSNGDINELNEISTKEQMKLFEEWFLFNYLKLEVQPLEKDIINDAYIFITNKFLDQKRTLCHFDFELRNLMLREDGTIGVLDFQDLTYGPFTLDLVSLIKDIDNPISDEEIDYYLEAYISLSNEAGITVTEDLISLNKDLDFAGLQRQLRILGTLARLHIRDGKSFRLPDLKQTLIYVIETSNKYDELKEFSQLLKSKVQPVLEEHLGGIND